MIIWVNYMKKIYNNNKIWNKQKNNKRKRLKNLKTPTIKFSLN